MSEGQIARYLWLVDRRLFLLLHSGIGFKPEYRDEIESVNKELAELRKVIDREHKRRAARHV